MNNENIVKASKKPKTPKERKIPHGRLTKAPRGQHFLKEWREFRGLEQQYVATLMGLKTSGSISKLENGVTPYDQDHLEMLSRIYQSTPAELISVDPTKLLPPSMIRAAIKRAQKYAGDRTVQDLIKIIETLGKS